jgi:hypothetical protein
MNVPSQLRTAERCDHIRMLPGLSRFLLPSLFPDLQRTASEGPVIIVNASKYSCDALVALDRDPVHIPLQIRQEGVRDLSAELHTLSTRAMKVRIGRANRISRISTPQP